jgi:hypothetical protein
VSTAFKKSIIPADETPSGSGMLLGNLFVNCPLRFNVKTIVIVMKMANGNKLL